MPRASKKKVTTYKTRSVIPEKKVNVSSHVRTIPAKVVEYTTTVTRKVKKKWILKF